MNEGDCCPMCGNELLSTSGIDCSEGLRCPNCGEASVEFWNEINNEELQ
jgi:predicted RNA-binding Zn-ribbon protein involved in translation (DUF1610 family)